MGEFFILHLVDTTLFNPSGFDFAGLVGSAFFRCYTSSIMGMVDHEIDVLRRVGKTCKC